MTMVTGSEWLRSSFCSGGQCAEVQYVRSSRCSTGNCVEVGHTDGRVLLRDGKLGDASPVLEISPEAWTAFLELAPTV
jgi:hypothetical protein